MKVFRGALPFMIAFLCSSLTDALDPKNPISLCDRFISEDEQKSCEHRMKKTSPDWYVAGVCDKLYSDVSFFECMSLASEYKVPPNSLETCSRTELKDDERIVCIKKLASDNQARNRDRLPASTKNKRR